MPTSWTAIASVTVGAGGASSIDFSSIPATYTDLMVLLSSRQSPASTQDTTWLNAINGSTANLSDRVLRGDGSSASSFVPSESPLYIGQSPCANATANTFANHMIYFLNYTSSLNKTIFVDSVQETNATTAYAGLTAGIWSNTAVINALSFTPNTGTFVQNTTATLFGLSKS
jgi:hypothetical protein